jgi:galactokinase
VGARVGIMDQFVSCQGQAGHALLLDCRSLKYRMLPLPESMQLLICNTMVKHQLQGSEYNDRRSECEEAVRRLAKVLPGTRSLRDVSPAQLTQHRGQLSETLYKRCRHVITENERVCRAASALESGDTGVLSGLMAESHRSLRDDYRVSCRELDIMVELAAGQAGVYGARMTGGGFGGCTINLVDTAHSSEFRKQISAQYHAATGLLPDVYVSQASQGVESVEIAE